MRMIVTGQAARVLTALLGLAAAAVPLAARAADGDWPAYNRALTSERFSPLSEITRENVSGLRVICSYDTGARTSFETGPIMVEGTLYATARFDTIALDAATCRERWRVHEDYAPASPLPVNRGAAYLDGRLFRGTQDGRVVAYDARTGAKLWETRIGKPEKGESVPAAPIAWSGLVFAGNAGGDNYAVKGRIYALDAASGEIVWAFHLVPKAAGAAADAPDLTRKMAASWKNEAGVPIAGGATWTSYTLDPETGLLYVPVGNPAPGFVPSLRPGANLLTGSVVVLDARTGAYKAHYPLLPGDFHGWGVAAAPALLTTQSGRRLLAAAPKDGYLYGYDLASGNRLYRTPVTRIENTKAPPSRAGTRFCPGTQGGVEWNGPAYSPETGLIYTGAVDWCSTVKVADPETVRRVSLGRPWSGSANARAPFGVFDPPESWAGWLYASDAETGEARWRFEAPAPLLSGVTPTAGGVVFFGDMAGTVYALDAASGATLWSHDLQGAVGGGVISYAADGKQRIAVAAGMTSPIWPTEDATGRIVVFGLE